MKRLFYAPAIAATLELPEDESLHCARVLRLKHGDAITITDGKGFFYEATLIDIHPKRCQVTVTKHWRQEQLRDYKVHIAVAPTKNMDRMEWFVEKATEIGVDTITFLQCRHSERDKIKLQRLNMTAISAMKQSQKAVLPLINEMIDFNQFITHAYDNMKMIAHCSDSSKQLINKIYTPGRDALILIGPEGDFSRDEIDAALSAGFAPISLGENRLRTETAAIVACHTIHLVNQNM